MNRSNAIFIGQSPLQVLNLIEASFKFEQQGLFYVVYDKEEIKDQAADILETLGIAQVIFQRRNAMFRIFFPFYIALLYLKIIFRQGRPENIFYGTYTTWASLLVNIISPKKTILIDDGQKTINIITNPRLVGLKNKYIPTPFSRDFVRRSIFFTYYDRIAAEHGFSTRRNNLEEVSQLYSKNTYREFDISESDIIFIGTNILNSYANIKEVISSIKKKAGKSQIHYFSHRRDEKKVLQELTNELGIKVVKNDIPIELMFSSMWRKSRPRVWAFSSTAVETLLMLNDELNITVFRLSPDGFSNQNTAKAFESIYHQYLKEPRITLTEVPLSVACESSPA